MLVFMINKTHMYINMTYLKLKYYSHIFLISKHRFIFSLFIYLLILLTLKNYDYIYCMAENNDETMSDVSIESDNSLNEGAIINRYTADAKNTTNNEYIHEKYETWINSEGKAEIKKIVRDNTFKEELIKRITETQARDRARGVVYLGSLELPEEAEKK